MQQIKMKMQRCGHQRQAIVIVNDIYFEIFFYIWIHFEFKLVHKTAIPVDLIQMSKTNINSLNQFQV